MRILVSGDWHGYPEASKAAAKKAEQEYCPVIVQVGDFGFWPHTNPEYVGQVNSHLKKRDISMVWVDGNHENFDVLFNTEWPKTDRGFWKIDDHVLYAPRGHRWEWDGVTFLALGGGYSIDKDWRLSKGPVGLYWWPQETITQRDVYNSIAGGAIDVMVTHDMPQGASLGEKRLYHNTPEDEQNRMAVRSVVDAVRPKRLYHGHYHHRHDSTLELADGTAIEVVALADWRGLPLSSTWVVLDTKEIHAVQRS